MFKVRIKNNMFGYERDQIVEIDAETEEEALKKAQDIDCFADINIVDDRLPTGLYRHSV